MKRIYISGNRVWLDARNRLPEGVEDEARGDFEFESKGERYKVYNIEEEAGPEGLHPEDIRESWKMLGDKAWGAVAKGLELCNWDKEEVYCRKCGGKLERHLEIAKRCGRCGAEWFAPMTPAIMVIVEDEKGRKLLVHGKDFKRPFYGLVAGFVETGETLEECVAREVREETGLEIKDIEYVESQSWPYPHQLMIGFHARLAEGELEFRDEELDAGGFYKEGEYPELAGSPSLARRLIDRFSSSES